MWLQATGLGLALASVIVLWTGAPFLPKATAMQGAAVLSFNLPAILERVAAGMNQRAATGLIALSLSLQLVALAVVPSASGAPAGLLVVAVGVATAAVVLGCWRVVREVVTSQRLVRVAANPPTDEVTPLRFLYVLDRERRGQRDIPLSAVSPDPRSTLVRRYGYCRGFRDLTD